MTKRKVLLIGVLLLLAVIGGVISTQLCLTAWVRYGAVLPVCPDGNIIQGARAYAYGLRRGAPGTLYVAADANYTAGSAMDARSGPIGRFEPSLELLDAKGEPVAMKAVAPWKDEGHEKSRRFDIPDVPDGDYVARATVKSALGTSTVDVKLAFYAPAQIHVITDRPLYQPGDVVKFRAVALRARDLSPLDGRPGKWFVIDPAGQTLLEERAPAGKFGVVAGSFPLDAGATSGQWTFRWESGGTTGERVVAVEPFTLPRFRVEAQTSRPFYGRRSQPILRGSVIYSSGAPVANAKIDISYGFGGWPPPTAWLEGLLKDKVITDDNGQFKIELPEVPGDLNGRVTASISLRATDPAGDVVTGGAAILMAEDPIAAESVTELGGHLVEGFNNRLYLRVATAAGRVLANSDLVIKRAWDPTDKGVHTRTDADGVAAMQIDPGPAVNIVLPPPPVRRPRRIDPVVRSDLRELITNGSGALADQVAMDKLNPVIEPCARFVDGSESVAVVLRVDRSGAVKTTGGSTDLVGQCVRDRLATRKLPAGAERIYVARFELRDPGLPRLTAEVAGEPVVLDTLTEKMNLAAREASACLPDGVINGQLDRLMIWKTRHASQTLGREWVADRGGRSYGPTIMPCVQRVFDRVALDEPANSDSIGTVRIRVRSTSRSGTTKARPTTMLGYELLVTASAGREKIGSTKIRLQPGQVPQVRLRATPVLAAPGGMVEVKLIRGPGFSGKLPEKLWLTRHGKSIESKLDPEAKTASFKLPADAKGWYEVRWSTARALVFVRAADELEVEVKPDKDRYKPGDVAQLNLRTTVGGQGAPAAVGLFGVDESLGQLVPLPGPGDLDSVRPKITTPTPAFGVLDGQALSMGRIRGEHASAATVLMVTQIPTPQELDVSVSGDASTPFSPIEALTDHFYTALGELHSQARKWEKAAPKGEQMKPSKMVALWSSALDACDARGEAVDDAYGRRLRLSVLPPELLALTDPRAVVVDGTRLPEDVEDWARWVAKERP